MKQQLYTFDLDPLRSQAAIIYMLVALDSKRVHYEFRIVSHGPGGGCPMVTIRIGCHSHRVVVTALESLGLFRKDDGFSLMCEGMARIMDDTDTCDWHEELRRLTKSMVDVRHDVDPDWTAPRGAPDVIWAEASGENWDIHGEWGFGAPIYIGTIDRQDVTEDLADCLDNEDTQAE